MTAENVASTAPLFAAPDISRTVLADGTLRLASREPLGQFGVNVVSWIRQWADVDPGVWLAAERTPQGDWAPLTYGRAASSIESVGQALLDRGLSKDRPLVILSENSLGHLLVALAAMGVGIPVVPVSVAYSTQSADRSRLKLIDDLVQPGAVYVEDAEKYSPATDALGSRPLILSRHGGPDDHLLSVLEDVKPTRAAHAAHEAVNGDTTAKIMFTSGSTGTPKGVITTHRMLVANQQMLAQVWPFLTRERPTLVDWLPWSHTFGGNHNVNLVLAHGGTLYIDQGRPTESQFATSLANYKDVAQTVSFNVPAGYSRLVPALERDAELATTFFSRMRLFFSAAAGLTPALKDRMQELSLAYRGESLPVTASWGTTETAPAATEAHFESDDSGCIGVPIPGAELKLVPAETQRYEIRIRGPLVTPGYFKRPDLTKQAFDDEGFYCPGDLVSFVDDDDPNRGLVFRGRIAEEFKLTSGTFVQVAAVRTALLSASPLLSDAVITGENHEFVGAIVWLNSAECRALDITADESDGRVLAGKAIRQRLGATLRALNADKGSASRIVRLLIAAEPPSLDAGEITDKGYINQRAVLKNRADLVARIHEEMPDDLIIIPT